MTGNELLEAYVRRRYSIPEASTVTIHDESVSDQQPDDSWGGVYGYNLFVSYAVNGKRVNITVSEPFTELLDDLLNLQEDFVV